MRTGILIALIASSMQCGSGADSVRHPLLSLGGGSAYSATPEDSGTIRGIPPSSVSTSNSQAAGSATSPGTVLASGELEKALQTAWLLPWISGRRRGRERKQVSQTASRSRIEDTSPAGAGRTPGMGAVRMGSPRAFTSALASFIGAMIVSGGTLTVCPQVAMASPFDPRPPPRSSRQPFFEGWFVRCGFVQLVVTWY